MDYNKCNADIFKNGTIVLISTSPVNSKEFSNWVEKIAKHSKLPVDWNFFADKKYVKALGTEQELKKIVKSIEKLAPELEVLEKLLGN